MTDSDQPARAGITNDDGLAPMGAWSVYRAPGQGHEPPIWPGYQTIPPAPPPGLPLPTQVGPMPMAVPPSQMPTGEVAPARAARRSRTADAALVLAAFVATAGVAFAIGRWSAPDLPSAAPMRAVSQLPAGVAVADRRGTCRAGVELPAGAQLPSTVEPTAAAAGRGVKDARSGGCGGRGLHDGARGHGRRRATRPSTEAATSAPGSRPRAGLRAPRAPWPASVAGGLQGMVSALEDWQRCRLRPRTAPSSRWPRTPRPRTSARRPSTPRRWRVGDLVSVELPFTGFRGQGDDHGQTCHSSPSR